MPAKILCPYLPDQLREVYSRKSVREIAADLTANAYPVSFSTVSHWLKEAGIERKVYSPYSTGKIASPFTPARLQELYWREGKSVSEIGALAGPLVGRTRPVEQATVTRWLKGAGVTLRTAAESQAVRAWLHPEQFKAGIEAAQKASAIQALLEPEKQEWWKQGNADRLRQVQRKHARAIGEAKKAKRETRPCAWAECSNTVTKSPSLFRHPPDRTYCCKSHASLHAAWLREISLAPPIAYRTVEKVRLTCAECGAAFERLPGHVRKSFAARGERHFCSKACCGRWSNKRRAEQVQKVVRPCARCGKTVERLPGQAKAERLYCSQACQRQDAIEAALAAQSKKRKD